MRRRPRILLNPATAVSLVVCVLTTAAWLGSYWDADQHVGLGLPRGRYSLHADRGRLILTGPPPAPAADEQAARRRLAGVRNDQFSWMQSWPADGGRAGSAPTPCRARPTSARA